MKLKDWADKQGISYLTAWRWFKAADPRLAKAYQSDSGTIIVPDELESSEQAMAGNTHNNAMSLFLKKTVEFSKSNSTVEDFAAYVLSNFSLKLNGASDTPKYSKQKPKSEEVQKHFQQFLPDKEKEAQLKVVKSLLKEGKTAGDIVPAESAALSELEFDEELSILSKDSYTYDSNNITEGLVTRSVDLNTTPQQINYTGSTNQAFSSSSILTTQTTTDGSILGPLSLSGDVGGSFTSPMAVAAAMPHDRLYFNASATTAVPFRPTPKELQSVGKIMDITETNDDLPRRRGRKPTKKR